MMLLMDDGCLYTCKMLHFVHVLPQAGNFVARSFEPGVPCDVLPQPEQFLGLWCSPTDFCRW